MSSARGQANHAIYLGRILITAWRRDLGAELTGARALTQAYLPAVRAHLGSAYGWFLLEITRPGALPDKPPRCLAELPEVAQGKAVPGEIREFQRLEQDGWIADLLSDEMTPGLPSSRSNLAISASDPGPEQAEHWADQLQSLFDRMGNSLDEY